MPDKNESVFDLLDRIDRAADKLSDPSISPRDVQIEIHDLVYRSNKKLIFVMSKLGFRGN